MGMRVWWRDIMSIFLAITLSLILSPLYLPPLLTVLKQDLHGKQKQAKRTTTFFEFVNAERGALITTDVAARGLDIPAVDWIVQFDPPDDPKECIFLYKKAKKKEEKVEFYYCSFLASLLFA